MSFDRSDDRPRRRESRDDPRVIATRVLLSVEEESVFSGSALSRALDACDLAPRDKDLATALVYGALAWQLRLDHTIAAYARGKSDKLDPAVRVLLRLGLLQMLMFDRIPEYAAVDSTVNIARKLAPKAGGLINAVLRRTGREGEAPKPGGTMDRLAVEVSHPRWLAEMWTKELGADEARALMEANNRAGATCYRSLIDPDEAVQWYRDQRATAEPAKYAPDGLYVRPAVRSPGIAIAQGEASQLVVGVVDPMPKERILDLCAAPGGKTAYMALLAGPEGSVTAVDPAPSAHKRIGGVVDYCGLDNVEFVHVAAAQLADEERYRDYDAVLVDAPCSGLGTLASNPEIRWRRELSDIEKLAGRQGEILDVAAKRVRAGGRLIYSTCTIARTENEDVVSAFLERHPDFHEERTEAPMSEEVFDENGRLRTFPHRHGTDGFFAVRLRQD